MPHLVLLGDSIFDNAAYTDGGPDVVTQLRGLLPEGWRATLAAVDGAQSADVAAQVAGVDASATHLVLSVGGNDALMASGLLDEPVYSSADALRLVAATVREFEVRYRDAVAACLARRLPLAVCTIYHGNFPDPDYRERAVVALTALNDAIVRTACAHGLDVIDLRAICDLPQDYANPIEPSSIGGAKIARAIAGVATGTATPAARLFGA
ncbi:MAG: SGNH/GDSL hydrolase family protein [Vitreoscilla sp.]